MTELLDHALQTVRKLSPAEQDIVARTIFALAKDQQEPLGEIDPAHLPDVMKGLAQAKRREFATDEEVKAAFARFKK